MRKTLEHRLEELSRKFGYAPYKMSRFEEYELYVRNKDFLQSDRVITFSGPDGRLLAMKPDVTLSIVKNAPETPGTVRKVHYRENVYRQDRDAGNFREILQAGIECVGDVGAYEVAEVVHLAAQALASLGEGTILSLSHVGLIRWALEKSGLPEASRKQALDCLGQKREQELRSLCAEQGADAAPLLALLRARNIGELEPLADCGALRELREITALLDEQQVRLDFSLGNDMKYYSGLVFKGYVRGVPASILQVIYNLISNAINYTGDDKMIYISQTVNNGVCRISVSDTGEGIPEDKLPHIWERYYRTGDFHKRSVTGTGLGLSIVKNALVLHASPFGVSSTLGKGSTFWFELPVYSEEG